LSPPPSLYVLLPSLRRFAAALSGAPEGRADELVLRAIHSVLREPPAESEAILCRKLRAQLTSLTQIRALPRSTPGAKAHPWEAALLDLPVVHRAALILVSVEGCSYDEAAQTLGISRAVLMGRLTAARHMLANSLQDATSSAIHAPHLRLVK
jgi:DNA-directed RNA polymerase specialized sigma24 family protein